MLPKITIEHVSAKFEETYNRPLRSNEDYVVLQIDINKTNKCSLSLNTIKRQMGIIAGGDIPRLATLDSIANYLGYPYWSDYSKQFAITDFDYLFRPYSKSMATNTKAESNDLTIETLNEEYILSHKELLISVEKRFKEIDAEKLRRLNELLLLIFMLDARTMKYDPLFLVMLIDKLKGDSTFYKWDEIRACYEEYIDVSLSDGKAQDERYSHVWSNVCRRPAVYMLGITYSKINLFKRALIDFEAVTLYNFLVYALFFNYESAIAKSETIEELLYHLQHKMPANTPHYMVYYRITNPRFDANLWETVKYYFASEETFNFVYKAFRGKNYNKKGSK